MVAVNAAMTLIICFGVPLGALICLAIFDRKLAVVFCLGAAAFGIAQILIRLPALTWIYQQGWFARFNTLFPIPTQVLIALSAGIFEETARFIALGTQRGRCARLAIPIAFGLGHGGVEAAYLGLSGLLTAGALLSLWPVLERIGAMTFHIAMSFVVYAAVMRRRRIPVLVAICIHGASDSLALLLVFGIVSTMTLELLMLALDVAILVASIRYARSALGPLGPEQGG